jgi:MFS family permease
VVLGGDALSAAGQGMSLPYLLVYLHNVRGMGLGTVGLVLSTVALASFVGNPLGGWLSDPLGAPRTLSIGLAFSAAGMATMATARTSVTAFVAAGLLGLGNSICWPALDTLLAGVVPAESRSSVFSVRHATLNAGLAIGAVIAALVVDPHHPGTFQAIYVFDAASFVVFIPVALTVRAPQPEPSERDHGAWRTILADRTFLSVVGLSALIVACSYSQYHAAFPGFATRRGGITARELGPCFAANAATVVVVQLFVLRWLHGRARTTAASMAGAVWAAAWLIALLAGQLGRGAGAVAGFAATMVVFGLAESLLSPTLSAIVNDLAPNDLRGRYNGVAAIGWTTGFFIGPAVAGALLAKGDGTTLLVILAAASAAASLWARALSKHLPATANRIGG